MEPLPAKSAKRKSRLRRVAIGTAVALAAVIASPFLFPAALVRYALNHSAYRDLHARFASASLSPRGILEVHDLIIDDAWADGKPLLSASTVRVEFSWSGLFSSRCRRITVENLHAWLRPGKQDHLTVLQLASAGASATPRPSTPAATSLAAASRPAPTTGAPVAGTPFWFDSLVITGGITVESGSPWQQVLQIGPRDSLRLALIANMSGDRQSPTIEIDSVIGDPDTASPLLASRLHVKNGFAGETAITVDSITASNLSPRLTRTLLGTSLPPDMLRDYTGRIAQIQLTGKITVDSSGGTRINGSAELRDASLQAEGPAPTGSALPLGIDHLNASTHVEGQLSTKPLSDLTWTRTRCSWDTLQVGTWRAMRGMADFQVEKPQDAQNATRIAINDLTTDLGDAQITAAGAYDLSAREWTRAHVWLKNADVAHILTRLPENLRSQIPVAMEATINGDLMLVDSDADHYAAHVELRCPDHWIVKLPPTARNIPLTTPPALSPLANLFNSVATANLVASATVTWSRRGQPAPEVAHGRLSADQLQVQGPPSAPPESSIAQNIIADFGASRGVIRLDDLYADLSGGSAFNAEAQYRYDTHELQHAALSLSSFNLSPLDALWPESTTVSGQVDSLLADYTLTPPPPSPSSATTSPRTAAFNLTCQTATPIILTMPNGTLAVGGTPQISLHASMDMDHRIVALDSANLHGLGTLHLDAPLAAYLLRLAVPPEVDTAREVLAFFDAGATMTLNDLSLRGQATLPNANTAGAFTGNLSIAGWSAGTPPASPNPLRIENTSLNATLGFPWSRDMNSSQILQALRIPQGHFETTQLTLGSTVFSGVSAQLSASDSRLSLRDARLGFADGTFTGNAAIFYQPAQERGEAGGGEGGGITRTGLDQLQVHFDGLNQAIVTKNLFPDSFVADGIVSGTLKLMQDKQGEIRGSVEVDANSPGRLMISRAIAQAAFARAIRSALEAKAETPIPPNLDDIIASQFANYPYIGGRTTLTDSGNGMQLSVDYTRAPLQPGDPGYHVKVAGVRNEIDYNFNLHGQGIGFPGHSVAEVVTQALGWQNFLLRRPVVPAATIPSSPAASRPNP